jgi:hypothetical protein
MRKAPPPERQCPTHVDSSKWHVTKTKDERGWFKVICGACGAFIGYQPPEDSLAEKQGATVEI